MTDAAPAPRAAHPILFLILFLPLGITNGYVVVTLAYILSQAGVGVGAIAALVAWSLFPQTWKVVWAPIVDATLNNKIWFFLSAIVIGVFMVATAAVEPNKSNLILIEIFVVIVSLATSFNAMAADSLMAYATPEDQKGRAGGWSQAGNLGGSGLGGGAGLWLAQHVHPIWISGAVLGLVCIASSVALLFVEEQMSEHRQKSLVENFANVARDVWSVVSHRMGLLVVFLMILPIGTGAAQNLWSAVAGDWHASADTVALVNGAVGGVVAMFGCIAGGFISDLLDRKTAYCAFGLISAVVAVAMALAPRTEIAFVVFTLIYAFGLGFCYASWGAVVLEAIGKGAAATKYNLLASISNMPIAYMTLVDGWGQEKWGSGGMLYTEALCGVATVGVFAVIAYALTKWRPGRELEPA
ncbi:MAG TPA: MFS transporter [Rhizomicrobium sp.]|jgi:MFS family permease